jgi:tRNA modification GTPase
MPRARPSTRGWRCTFPAPHSYTGEDVLELQAHGGPVVLQLLLARCLEAAQADPAPRRKPGAARPARGAAGRVHRAGLFNDKIDLAQAEAIADLIDASTEAAARSASRSLSGAFSQEIHACATRTDPPAHAGGGHAGLPRRRD